MSVDMSCFQMKEVDCDEIPDRIILSTETPSTSDPSSTYPSQNKSSRKRKKKSDLREALDRSVKKGELDLLQAGLAIHNAYESDQAGTSHEISLFLKQNITSVPFPQMPASLQINSNPVIPLAMIHGYGLAAQMALALANSKTKSLQTTAAPSKDYFYCVTDNFDCVKSKFNYPSIPPFSGEPIDINLIPVMESYAPAHVRLQNYLFHLLGRSCTNQVDIQKFWTVPGEKNYHYGNPAMFPRELYDNLRQLFLEFFRLDYDELDHAEYSEEFSNLPQLSEMKTPETKKQLFEDLAAAKKAFKNSLFLLEFKAAMKELRHATFVRFDGIPGGYFTKRQRHLPKSMLNKNNAQLETPLKSEEN